MSKAISIVLLSAALLAAPAELARAGKWPKPAAGPSATGGPEVVLTFDDGPHPRYTAEVLDVLEARGIRAIFFWVGRRVRDRSEHASAGTEARRALVQRALRDGHIVANHTLSHANLCRVDGPTMQSEVLDNAAIFSELTGMPIVLFRSPYGAKCDSLVALLESSGIAHLHWDIDPQEWKHQDSQRVAEAIIGKLRHLEGRAVVLMHDNQSVTTRALPEILDWIDTENHRRIACGERTIRIVSGSEVVAEMLNPQLSDWVTRAASEVRYGVVTALTELVP